MRVTFSGSVSGLLFSDTGCFLVLRSYVFVFASVFPFLIEGHLFAVYESLHVVQYVSVFPIHQGQYFVVSESLHAVRCFRDCFRL